MHWITISGNPKDGFNFIGPFSSFEAAMETAHSLKDDDWWISRLKEPARDMSQVVEVTDPRD